MRSFNCEMHFIFLMRKGTTNYLSAKQYYKNYNQHALINIVRHCVNVLYIFPRCLLYTFIALVSLMNRDLVNFVLKNVLCIKKYPRLGLFTLAHQLADCLKSTVAMAIPSLSCTVSIETRVSESKLS